MVPPVVLGEEVAAAVISPADGVTVRTETGNKLSTELLESVYGAKNGVRVDVDVAAAVPVSMSAITGVIVLPDAGSELPADFAEAEEITFGLAGMDSGGSVSREFSDVGDEQIAVGGSTWTAVVPVNMVNIQTDNVGDDRFSPGVRCCADMAYRERSENMGSDSDSSADCGSRPPGDVDFDYHREYEAECD